MADQPYIKGTQPGYDKKAGKWRRSDGRFATKERALDTAALIAPPKLEGYGMVHVPHFENRYSAAIENIERMISGVEPNRLQAAIARGDEADAMPSDILAMMKLAEYYWKVEGDVAQTIIAPLEIGLRELRVSSKDKGVETEFKKLYDETSLDMLTVLQGIWTCTRIYGQAFPLEVYDGKEPQGVFLLNPKNVEVGRTVTYGHYDLGLVVEEGWEKKLEQQVESPMIYEAFHLDDWDFDQGPAVPIKLENCEPVRDVHLPFRRYAIPPLARASRAISTRQVLEELIRATIEGYMNQLWVFKLGTEDHPPSPIKVAHFHNVIGGMAGDRTGYLVWDYGLEVERHAPETLDEALGDETWSRLTAQIFRCMGANARIHTGEDIGTRQTRDIDVDVKVMLHRLEWVRNLCIRWLKRYNYRYAKRQKSEAMLDNLPQVEFGRLFLELEQIVQGYVQPLMMAGKISNRTTLEVVGLDYDEETQRKKDEAADRGLYTPDAVYAQYRADGGTVEYSPEGRPAKGEIPRKPIKVAAAEMELPEDVQQFENRITSAYEEILSAAPVEGRVAAVEGFVDTLRSLNDEYIADAYHQGYLIAGGATGDADQNRIQASIAWNEGFVDNFEADLMDNVEDDAQLARWRTRAKLYAREGHKKGFMMGIFQAQIEQGMRGWRRILHPEASRTGPCELCIADSRLVHPIEVEFWEPHPHGVCTQQSVYFYRFAGTVEVPVGFPVPDINRIIRRVR